MSNTSQRVREQICEFGRLLYQKGLLIATDGSLSTRLADGKILITPSGVNKGRLRPEMIVCVDETGRVVNQNRVGCENWRPSSELSMHLAVYRARGDVGAVIHAHPPYGIACTFLGIRLDEVDLPEIALTLRSIPTVPFAPPMSPELARAIKPYIKTSDAVLLEKHGCLTVGQTLELAVHALERLEFAARMAYMLQAANPATTLD